MPGGDYMTVSRFLRNYIPDESPALDKSRLIRDNLDWLLNKTARMFEYRNLPPTITHMQLERLLQYCGACAIYRVPSTYTPVGYGASFNCSSLNVKSSGAGADAAPPLYAFPFTFAEAPDPYDEPYQVVITNPGFRPTLSATLEINKDVVVIRNDTHYRGLYQLHRKYAELLTEAEISLRSTLIVLRDQLLFIAKTETQRRAVEAYIKARSVGEPSFIASHDLGTPLEAITQNTHTNAVELAVNGLQSIRAAWYNEIGLNPSFSMKREYTSAQEIDTNTDLLMPIIDDMYESRCIGVENINALFGTNITVHKSSAWRVKDIEITNTLAETEAEVTLLEVQAEAASEPLNVKSSESQEGGDNNDNDNDTKPEPESD